MATSLRIRTEAGEESLDLEEFEARVSRGEIAPHCPVYFPTLSGHRWVKAGDLELFRVRFSPAKHTFARRFHLARVPWLTFGLIVVNFAVFLWMQSEGPIDTDPMVKWGAKVAPLIGDLGQFWRLLAANFIHRDLVHIGFNAFVIFNVGGALENAYRPVDYLLLLFVSALGCTVTSLALAANAISVGASGIAYGAMGGAVVFGLKYRELLPSRYRRILGEAAIPTILVFLYIGWTSTEVDNWGHLGGLLFGAATAAFLPPRLLLDQPTSLASTVIRLSPMVLVTGFLLFGGRVLAPALPPLAPVSDDDFGLLVRVPTTWRRVADRFGQMAYYNGLPGLGRAAFAANAHAAGSGRTLQDEVDEFVKSQLQVPAEANRLTDLTVEKPQPTQLAGRDALLLQAHYQDEGGPTHVRAYFVPRGNIVYQLVFALPEVYSDYERVAEEMLGAIRFTEPAGLREVRGRVLLSPGSVGALAQLGDALSQLGEVSEAAAAFVRAESLRPTDADLKARLAQVLFQEGQVESGCLKATEASTLSPGSLEPLLARADCSLARGDVEGARTSLELAQKLAPDDRGVLRRLGEVQVPPEPVPPAP